MNPALKYLWHRFAERSDRWRPFLAVHYLTYQCDFRCPYCSNGFATPYHQLHQEQLPAAEFLQVLGRIRRHCDYVVLTGGEPLQHPQFAEILAGARSMRFRDLALNTNGYDLERFLPQIAASIDTLIVSLDTLERDKADAWLGRSGAFDRIRSNLLVQPAPSRAATGLSSPASPPRTISPTSTRSTPLPRSTASPSPSPRSCKGSSRRRRCGRIVRTKRFSTF